MTDLVGWLDRLAALPTPALYVVLALAAAAENLFPPLPADTVVAVGAFVAARGAGSWWGSLLATLVGNIAGAGVLYRLGWRYGRGWLVARAERFGGERVLARVQSWHGRFGLPAIALTRFLPALRAVVPPLAGALHLRPVTTLTAMTLASAAWYGLITWCAFQAGANLEEFLAVVQRSQRALALGALAVVVIIGGAWWLVRRTRRASAS
ncbi:MAG: DedA family protein [Gemmatimonadaceae bacterium]|jgi:membrane protein DedA with SNARE-associated domain|nr:DedA family protein [Gemmatimonadaceae bacterium]